MISNLKLFLNIVKKNAFELMNSNLVSNKVRNHHEFDNLQEMEEEFLLELVEHEKLSSIGDGGCPPYTANLANRATVYDAGKLASGNRHSMAM